MSDMFRVIVLGCSGGPRENNLSGYLLYPTAAPDELIAFDAGTLISGLDVAYKRGNLDDFELTFTSLTVVGEVFQKRLKNYLISHGHLDHISGLVINSQVDSNKHILGIDSTIDDLKNHIFNWVTWPNCANEGKEPFLNRYEYIHLPLQKQVAIPGVKMRVETFLLSHPREYPSSAFLIEREGEYVLYFGDTSPDALEKEKHMHTIWERIAPIVKEGHLHGIFLECSVPDEDAGQVVYGHLNPQLFMQEFQVLQKLVGGSIEGLKVIVTHRKETLYTGEDQFFQIEKELRALNSLNLDLIFPSQGDKIIF